MAGIREKAEKARPVLLAQAERAEREVKARQDAAQVWPLGSNERAAEVTIGQRRGVDAQGLRAALDCTDFALSVTSDEMRMRLSAVLTRAMEPHLRDRVDMDEAAAMLHGMLNGAMALLTGEAAS